MAFLRRTAIRPEVPHFLVAFPPRMLINLIIQLPMRRASSDAKKGAHLQVGRVVNSFTGIGKSVYEPKHWETSPPTPLPVSDPVTGWTKSSKRVGAIGFKLGMSSDFDSNYELAPLTFIQVSSHSYSAVLTRSPCETLYCLPKLLMFCTCDVNVNLLLLLLDPRLSCLAGEDEGEGGL